MALHAVRMIARGPLRAAVLLSGLLGVVAPSPAQNALQDIKYTKQTRFWIPFDPEGRIRSVELHCSKDQGRTWTFFVAAAPAQRGFQFFAERDGIYWFAVRTIDLQNIPHPQTLEGSQPQLVVCVDTAPPSVRLAPLTPQEGVGVSWEVRDDNLDLSTLRLESRAPGGNWQSLQADPVANGRWTWQAGAVPFDEVRLQVRDKAGNLGEGLASLSGRRTDNRAYVDPGAANPGRPPVRLVNSTRISINYRVEDVGPSSVTLELWWTRNNGRTWEKHPEPVAKPPCIVNAPQEGLYGFTLVARSGVNLGDRPPQAGDPPQILVEVDLKEPVVQLTSVEVGRGQDANKMTIRWTARDSHLDERPVKLEYASVTLENANAPDRAGPWQEISNNLPAAGEHIWLVPTDGVLYHVRAVARDRAGNVGQARTIKPVVVDLSRPRGIIIDVEPVKGPSNSAPPADSGNSITIPSRGPGAP